ncbi:MAG: sigma factor [Muribaculaceae bacterium]
MNGLQEVNREELITLEEEVALIKQIQQSPDDCEAAKQKLLLVNRRFVRAIVDRYADESRSAAELIAEGNKGLLHAAEKYDATTGFKFISYAQYWIKASFKQYIMSNSK